MRRKGTIFLAFLLGAGLLGFILERVGWREVLSGIARLGGPGILALSLSVALAFTCGAASWRTLMRAYGVTPAWGALLRIKLGGFAVSYLTPLSSLGGEPVSIYLMTRQTGAPPMRVAATLIVAKFLEGLSLIGLICLGSLYLFWSGTFPEARSLLIAGNALLGALLLLGLINFAGRRLWASRMLSRLLRHLIARTWAGTLVSQIREIEEEIAQAFRRHRRATLGALAISMLGMTAIYLRPWIFFHFSEGLSLTAAELAAIFGLYVVLATFFWITPAGLGVVEGGMIGIFRLINLSAEGAVAYALAVKGLEITVAVLGVVILLRLGFGRLLEGKKAQESPQPPEDRSEEEPVQHYGFPRT
jgi:hypothetical protein